MGTIISIDPECQKYSKGLCVAQIQDSVGKIYEIDYGGENFCQLGATDRAPTIFHGKIDPQIFQANVGDTLEIFARLNIVTKTVNRFSTCWRVPGYYLNILKN